MKKRLLSILIALAVLPTCIALPAGAKAQTPDYSLWEKFLKYDLCIADYSSLTDEEKELCRFIFETEQSTTETIICERARRALAHDLNIGERLTLEQLDGAYGVWDNYSPTKIGYSWYIHCVPDIKHLDGWDDYNEYWLDDEGNTKVYSVGENTGREQYDGQFCVISNDTNESSFIARKTPAIRSLDDIIEYKPDDFIEYNGDYYYITLENTAVFAASQYSNSEYIEYEELRTEPFVIPNEVNGYPVTEIGSNAFQYSPLTEMVIPDTVNFIDWRAFGGCDYIKSIDLPSGLKYLGRNSILITNTENLNIDCPDMYISREGLYIRSEDLYLNVREIGENGLTGNTMTKNIRLGDDVQKIGAGAFRYCYSLENVEISSSVRSIGQGAFLDTNVRSITIPPTVEVIGALPRAKGVPATSGIEYPATHPLTNEPECAFESDCVIYGYMGTEAERYANEWDLEFIPLEAEAGDVNIDGEINIADAVTLQRYLLGNYVRTGAYYGDLNEDGNVNSFDMVMMRERLTS